MKIYKLTFARDIVLSCKEITMNTMFNGLYQYEQKDGQLIYALVKADNEDNALTIANFIQKEIRRNTAERVN